MKPTPVDPALIKDSDAWEVFEVTPEYRRSILQIDDNTSIMRTEWLVSEQMLEQNRQSYNDSFSQRFGDGKVVASVPMHIWSREVAPRLREGDLDFTRWYLNQEKNRPFRTFRGKI
jgi:hypothetical protein